MAKFQPKLRGIEESATLTQTKLSPLSAAFVPKNSKSSTKPKSTKQSLPNAQITPVPIPPMPNALNMNMFTTMSIMHQQQTTNHALSVQGLQNNYNALLNTYSNLTQPPPNVTNLNQTNQLTSNNVDFEKMKNSEIINLDLSLSELLEKNLVEKLISDLNGLEHIQQKLKNAAITIQKVKDIMYSPRIRPKASTQTKSQSPKSSTKSGQTYIKSPKTKIQKVSKRVHAQKPYNPIRKVLIQHTKIAENSPSPSVSTVSAKSSLSLSSSSSVSKSSMGQTDYFQNVYGAKALKTTNRFNSSNNSGNNNIWRYTSNDRVASSYNPFLDPKNDKLFDQTLREMKELNNESTHHRRRNFKRFGLRDESKATLIKMECGEWLEKNK